MFRVANENFGIWLLGLGLCVLAACGGGEPEAIPQVEPQAADGLKAIAAPPGRPGLVAIPPPDLQPVQRLIRQQAEEEYSALAAVVGRPAVDDASLGSAYGEAGVLFLGAAFHDTAEACLTNARTLAPGEAAWPYFLAHIQLQTSDPAAAIPWFERVLELEPDDVASLVWLGRTLQEQGESEVAERQFRRALELNPGAASARLGLGRVALDRRDHAEAVRWLSETLEMHPEATIAHYPLALAFRGLGDLDKAQEHVEQRGEVDLFPHDPRMDRVRTTLKNPLTKTNDGMRAYAAGRWQEAVEAFRAAVELDPEDPLLRTNLAVGLYRLEDPQGTSAQFDEALRLRSDHAPALYGAGVLLERRGDDPGALERYRAAVAADPAHVPANLRLAHLLNRAGRVEEALDYYDAVIRRNPRHAEARLSAAVAMVKLGKQAEAKLRFEEAMVAMPDQPAFAHGLARLLVASPDDAVRDGPRALELLRVLTPGPASTDLGETVAMALAESGQFEQAVQWQRSAISVVDQAGRADLIEPMARRLARYESGQPCRVPWNPDDPIFLVPGDPDPGGPIRRPAS